jgi:tetratricopeptide (TPR) repeat protein
MSAPPTEPTDRDAAPRRRGAVGVALGLVLLALAAYWHVGGLGFVSLDDPQYVSANPLVLRGLTVEGLRYAFTTTDLGNWHPLTWLSHMLVVELAGPAPAAHHLANLLLHLACVVLLFAFAARTIRVPWAAALAAGIFAVHPLHVESVAWVAERKDVLSTVFWLLAMLSHLRWAETGRRGWYVATCAALVLGLMSKPMLVTLPLALLLLDVWPLRRWRGVAVEGGFPAGRLVLEKLPLLALAFVAGLVTLWAQAVAGAMQAMEPPTSGLRLANAVRSVGIYLLQTVWPSDLAVFYPYPASMPLVQVALAAAALVAISLAAVALARRAPWLPVGWLWFLLTLAPVLGIVQVGSQAHADRYTYVPHIGLFLALAFGLERLTARLGQARWVRFVLALALLGGAVAATRAQVEVWRDDRSLFEHAIEATGGSHVAHDSLGRALQAQGRLDEAVAQYRASILLRPDFASAYINLGTALEAGGDATGALESYRSATELAPGLAEAWVNLGGALARAREHEQAAVALERALEIAPRDALAHMNAALNELLRGRRASAVDHFRAAVEARPELGRDDQALLFAWMMATDPDPAARDGELAAQIAQAALERSGGRSLPALEALAAAEAECGRFEQATRLAEQALQAARAAAVGELVARLEVALQAYRARKPLRTGP